MDERTRGGEGMAVYQPLGPCDAPGCPAPACVRGPGGQLCRQHALEAITRREESWRQRFQKSL